MFGKRGVFLMRNRDVFARWSKVGIMLVVVTSLCVGISRNGDSLLAADSLQPIYIVPVQAIRVADSDGRRIADITSTQVKQWVDKANSIYASAGIQFQFDPNETGPDWSTLKNTAINNLSSAGTGWNEANDVAAQYPGKLVVFFRYGEGSERTGNGFSYPTASGLQTNFVAMPGFNNTSVITGKDANNQWIWEQNIWLFSHEAGHYFDLYHTFPGWNDDDTDTPAKASRYITSPSNCSAFPWTCANAGTPNALDGDNLADTPPEAGTKFYTNQGWDSCKGHDSYTLKGYTFTPDRHNVMSYFACDPMTFTASQIDRMHRAAVTKLSVAFGLPESSEMGPALAYFAGRLYLAWTGVGNSLINIISSGDDLIFEATTKVTLSEMGPKGVALDGADKLTIGWTGTDSRLNLIPSSNGKDFGDKVTLDETSNVAPALRSAALVGLPLPGRLFVAWTGTDGRLNLISSTNGRDFGNKVTLSEMSNTAPALTDFRGKIYIAWRGTDGRLNVMSSTNGRDFGEKVTLGETSDLAPTLEVFNSSLHIAWTGTDGRLNVMYSSDGMNFVEKKTFANTSKAGPALARLSNLRGPVALAWTGPDGQLILQLISP